MGSFAINYLRRRKLNSRAEELYLEVRSGGPHIQTSGARKTVCASTQYDGRSLVGRLQLIHSQCLSFELKYQFTVGRSWN